jgi:oxaloacetate decarboxylase gamma subunit
MEANLVVEGLKFMFLGMGTVYLFLVIMIVAMNLQAKILHRFFPEPNEGAVPAPTAQPAQQSKNNKVAAIVAAIIEDKKKNS